LLKIANRQGLRLGGTDRLPLVLEIIGRRHVRSGLHIQQHWGFGHLLPRAGQPLRARCLCDLS
jgi:hypothetical protein